jgi:hypothetical protein
VESRRLRECYEAEGAEGLIDQRRGPASRRRGPTDQIEFVVEQYQTPYGDFTVLDDAAGKIYSLCGRRASAFVPSLAGCTISRALATSACSATTTVCATTGGC